MKLPFGQRRRKEQELEEEIQSHLRMATNDRIGQGEREQDARNAAYRELGNSALIKEVTGGTWGWERLQSFFQDARYALRVLQKSPGVTLLSIVTLALGIGATTAIFSVVHGVLLSPLPYAKADQIVRLWEVSSKGNRTQFADPNFDDLRSQNHSLQGMAEYADQLESVSGGSESARVTVATVSHDFLDVMGVRPVRGRSFAAEDERFGVAPVALVSYGYWRQYLGSTQDLSAPRLKIGGDSGSVIGVLPPGFRFPDESQIWLPRELYERVPSRTAHNWRIVARLNDGVAIQQVRSDLSGIAQRLKQQYGNDTRMVDVAVSPLQEAITGDVRRPLMILLGAVGFLLLVACANVVNLTLAQATARASELSVRTALGASRGRLLRQFLTESLFLSLIGGLLGVAAAIWGVRGLVALAPRNFPRLETVTVDLPVLIFALGLSVVVAVGLGIFTALRATSKDLSGSLVDKGRSQAGTPQGQRMGRVIVTGQLAITLVLLVGAGLLGRSLLRVLSTDPGFRTEHVLTLDLALPPASQPDQKVVRVEFIDHLFEKLRALPGVQDVGATNSLPLGNGFFPDGAFVVMTQQQITPRIQDLINRTASGSVSSDPALMKEFSNYFDQLFHDTAHAGSADYLAVSEGYFRTVGIPLLRGRLFDDRDSAPAPHVALISESLARKQWPKQDPLGQTIEFGNMDGDPRLLTIVGVVGDVRDSSLEAPPSPTVYVNYRQRPQRIHTLSVVLRTNQDPAFLVPTTRKLVRELDPTIPPNFNTFSQVFVASLNSRRFILTLVGAFALTALLLAIAGIYGVMAYSVVRRTREIGVRIALGASTSNILGLILRQAVLTSAIGLAIGIAGSLALTRTMQSLLFEISPNDPATFAAVAALLVIVALVAKG